MSEQQPSGWAIGWTAFAGIMMVLMGGWWVIAGLVGLFNSEFYVVTRRWIFEFNVSTWGWIHLLTGYDVDFLGMFGFFLGMQGVVFNLLVSKVPLLDARGEVEYVVSIGVDITELTRDRAVLRELVMVSVNADAATRGQIMEIEHREVKSPQSVQRHQGSQSGNVGPICGPEQAGGGDTE